MAKLVTQKEMSEGNTQEDVDLKFEENENIDDLFRNIIRTTLTENEFWKWVRLWKSVDTLCEDAENWDTDTKKGEIKELFLMFPRLKKEFEMDKLKERYPFLK